MCQHFATKVGETEIFSYSIFAANVNSEAVSLRLNGPESRLFFFSCRSQEKLQRNLMYLAAIADSQPRQPAMYSQVCSSTPISIIQTPICSSKFWWKTFDGLVHVEHRFIMKALHILHTFEVWRMLFNRQKIGMQFVGVMSFQRCLTKSVTSIWFYHPHLKWNGWVENGEKFFWFYLQD